ncbi:MAG: flagellar basal-body MS-ring/collar protein FliF [Thermovenabulum sp.]|uniref:flagellar basal-body MS-ring/collar protein FliF n=1 Tax=Thermovenabulum sp. TaxID=3100335 RepID=UPI003C7DC700
MNIEEIKTRILEFWESKNKSQKVRIIGGTAVVLLLFISLLYFATRPQYSVLYSNLDMKDAGEIVKRLDAMKVRYRLTDGGRTIEVESKDVYKVRLSLAQEGLPNGGEIGFNDLFGKMNLGMTEWEKQMRYNQALQGELTRTIKELNQVEEARVHLVIPQKTLFIDPSGQKEASAAVFLKLKPGEKLGEEEVKGIINLISHSVEGLKPENVTIVDEYGRVLSNLALSENDSNQIVDSQLAVQYKFQNDLQSKVQSLLEQIFGPGNVAVRVNAQLNFDKRVVENKLFTSPNPESGEGILRSVQEIKEYFNGNSNQAVGVPGTTSQVPGYQGQQNQGGSSNYQKSETVKNYEVNESIENITVAPGAVKKLTVSVVVNRQLTDEEKNKIASLVGSAIGYDSSRDTITVEGMTFENSLTESLARQIEEDKKRQARQRIYVLGFSIIAALLIFITVRRILNARKKEMEEKLAQQLLLQQQAAASSKAEEDLLALEEKNKMRDIEMLVKSRPEDVAKIIRSWLNEE